MTEPRSFMQRLAEQEAANKPAPPPPIDLGGDTIAVLGVTGSIPPYAAAAIAKETAKLAAMGPKSGRNHQLNRSAFSLRRFVDNGSVSEQVIFDALMAAAGACGVLDEDGEKQCRESIESGFKGSTKKVGARPIPEMTLPSQVTEVDPESLGGTAPPPPGHPLDRIVAAEGDFWQRRTSLTHIYDAALGRMCAPWAVLAHCAARALLIVRPCATLPPLIGGPGSLNSFFIIAAQSGGGKSAAADVARELIDQPFEQRALGSGEGLLESYLRPEDKETGEPAGYHEAILFLADESDTISAMSARSGSTLLSTLRTVWTGATLSFGYRGRSKQKLAAHTYRATLVMAMQPSRAGWILGDGGGGTPQRFLWFPGVDRRISLEAWTDRPLDQMALPSWREWEYDTALTIPDEARNVILSERVKAARGDQVSLDGHALFCREKFAYALAVLDGRTEMNAEDWELAGTASAVSDATRAWVVDSVTAETEREAEDRGRLMGAAASVSDDEKAFRAAEKRNRIGGLILERLAEPMTEGALRKSLAGRDRPWLPSVLEALQNAGRIGRDDQNRWVKK